MADFRYPDSFMYYRAVQRKHINVITRVFSTNRNFPIFISKNSDWFVFFFKLKPKFFCQRNTGTWWVSSLASVLFFCRFSVLSGVCGLSKVYFSLGNIFPWRLTFSTSFFETCDIFFLNTNSVSGFVSFFVALVMALLFWLCHERFVFILVCVCCLR